MFILELILIAGIIFAIYKLNQDESIHELARMLGGVEITDAVLENAQEMKELARMKK